MTADTNPSANFSQEVRKHLLTKGEIDTPAQGIEATKEKVIQGSNIKVQFVIAQEDNPWGYDAGVFLKTNIPPESFSEQNGTLETTLANFAMVQLLPMHAPDEANISVSPRYTGPDNGVIFQLAGKR